MYLKLVKVFFKENYSLRRILGTNTKQSKTKTILLSLLLIYAFGSIMLSFGFLFFELGKIFKQLDSLDSLLIYIFIYSTFLSAFFVILRASGYLFVYKDYDFLGALPLKNEVVIAAKITVMLVMVYLTTYLLSAPMIFSYFYHGGFSIYQLIIILLSLLFIPIIPLIIFSFISLLMNYGFTKFRISKLINIVFTFGLLIVFMYYSFSFSADSENPFLNQQAFLKSISEYIPTVTLFNDSIINRSFFSFILFALINIVLIIGYIYLIKNFINKTNQMKTTTRFRKNKNVISKQRSIMETLIRKEVKTFFSINVYVLNTGFGPVLFLLGGFASFFYAGQLKDMLVQVSAQTGGDLLSIEYIVLLPAGFILSTVFTSAVSLSLEGKNLWFIQSLPIKPKTVMMSKLFFNVLVGLPFAIFFVLTLGFSLSISLQSMIVMIILLTSFSFTTSIMGSIINLFFPKFNYQNETEVVKQSIGGLLGLFSGLGLLIILGVIQFYLFIDLPIIVSLLLLSIINALIFCGLYIFLDKKVESLFIKFS